VDFERSFDVLVAGAGIAGVAAALESARAGLRTALVEKSILVGGLATTGLVNVYLPLCDGQGRQVIHGLAEELFHLSFRYGPGDVPPGWGKDDPAARTGRYRTTFSPASFVLALDEALVEAGVEVWLDTLVSRPVMERRRVVGMEVENKSGRGVLRAACVVDATGDADVAHRAGAPCVEADNWLTLWALQASLDTARRAAARPEQVSLLDGLRLGADDAGHGALPGREKLYGTDGEQVTRFVLETRRMLREHYRAQQAQGGDKDRHHLFPVTLPAMAQFRTTRRIVGQATLSDGQHGRHVDTSAGVVADWRKAGYLWEIPYGTLIPRRVRGLLAAGRCISSEGDAWQITRVIPVAALTGQVAGVAARLSVEHGTTPDRLPVGRLQQELRSLGLPLHIEEIASRDE
jgi:glycine/D-amino acid oxidase-like deaminating enzyme